MREELLMGLLITQSPTIVPTNQCNTEIFQELSEKKETDKTYQTTGKEVLEILKQSIKKEIIQGTIVYFNKHTTIKLTDNEKVKIQEDLNNYLLKYPDIITISGNKVILKINENNFRELFKILLPYFGRGEALKGQPEFIKNNDGLILRNIKKSKGEKAEFYFFHYFGYLIMDIVNEINKVQSCDLTIKEYIESMLKGLYITYIADIKLSENILNDSVKNLSKYF